MMETGREHGFERLGRGHMTVRELLTEMKDTSEIIVDLAYAALMFNSDEIGEEVKSLVARMDALNQEIRIKAMLASRTVEDAVQLSGLLQVADAAASISAAAGDVVGLLDLDIATRPFISFVLKDAEEKIRLLTITSGSDMVNNALGELSVESETGMRIIAIKRGIRWMYDPDDAARLKGGDKIIVRGTEDGYERLKRFAGGEEKWPQYPPED